MEASREDLATATDLCILIRRPPYGSIFAAEGIRHLIGAIANGLTVGTVLVGRGVWVAKAGQDPGETAWTSLCEALSNVLRVAEGPTPQILVDQDSLIEAGLKVEDLVSGVRVASPETVAELVATARHLIIF
ncbi:MAG: DsrE family protein [candidate division NC10 bacterium]